MQSRSKPLNVIEPISSLFHTNTISFDKPEEKGNCKLVDADNVSELVNLLQNEAKVI